MVGNRKINYSNVNPPSIPYYRVRTSFLVPPPPSGFEGGGSESRARIRICIRFHPQKFSVIRLPFPVNDIIKPVTRDDNAKTVVRNTNQSQLPDDMEVGSDKHLDHVYKKFVRWKAADPKDRSPSSIQQFSKEYKVTAEQIADFKERPGYHDQIEKHAKNWGRGKIPEMLHTLYEKAKNSGKPKEIREFIDLVTEDSNSGGDTQNTLNLFNLSDERFEEIAKRATGEPPREAEVSDTVSTEESD